jgi:hypothetical protein
MAKIAPVGRTLTESPDPLAIRKRSRSSRRGVVRISIDESNIAPPVARDLSYIGLPAESGKARQLTPIVPVSLILTGRNPYVEMFRGAKALFHPDNAPAMGEPRPELRY